MRLASVHPISWLGWLSHMRALAPALVPIFIDDWLASVVRKFLGSALLILQLTL